MKKIAIIGAGNMGGAIARGLAQGSLVPASNLIVANPSRGKLEALKQAFPAISITHDNQVATAQADIVVLAVKPWKMKEVIENAGLTDGQTVISVAAGISLAELSAWVGLPNSSIFRVIPNTAISVKAGMSLIATNNAPTDEVELITSLFNELGLAMVIEEKQFAAATSLTSCGIAYVFKYVQAAMQAGVELGIRPADAIKMLAQTLDGAAQILLQNEQAHPSTEIDKVTTPGGYTIKGVNTLEHEGFSAAIIKAIKASC